MDRSYQKTAKKIRDEYANEIESAMLKMAEQNQISTTTEGLIAASIIALRKDASV